KGASLSRCPFDNTGPAPPARGTLPLFRPAIVGLGLQGMYQGSGATDRVVNAGTSNEPVLQITQLACA
ncbi:MAG TPA: hypothetical protein VH702_06680, partial [Vicinamibacterales bacterium]